MRFRLRTLLIWATLAPPLLALLFFDSLSGDESVLPGTIVFVVVFLAFFLSGRESIE